MKAILKALFLNLIVLYVSVWLFAGLEIDGRIQTLILAAIILTALHKFVKPIIKLLLLPINLLTLGIFGWVSNVLMLFLAAMLVDGLSVTGFYFTGFAYEGFVIPAMQISLLVSYILASLVMSIVRNLMDWLLK